MRKNLCDKLTHNALFSWSLSTTIKINAKIKIIFHATLWILLASCANTKEHPNEISDTSTRVDSTLFLKFTSGVRSVLEDRHGNFWFGSHNEGVARYDGKNMTYFTTENGLSHNQVRTIMEDAYGNVWFECGKGLSRYSNYMLSRYLVRDYTMKDTWRPSAKDIWFKGDEMTGFNEEEGQPGAYRFNGQKMIFQAFPFRISEDDINNYSVSAPIIKGKNMVWFATYGAVIGYDGAGFTILDKDRLNLNDTTGNLHVRSIFEDSQGTLWIGNNGIGVLKYDGDTIVNISKSYGLVPKDSKHNGYASPPGTLEHVFSIAEDKHGNMWFGDRDTGAWRFDGNTFENFTLEDGLTSNHIWAIYKDKKGELWYAMADGSVCRFNGKSFYRVF